MSGSSELRELSTGELVGRISEQVSRLVRDELRLAQAELRRKGRRIGAGAGLAGAAGVFALFGVGALVLAAIAALAIVLPAWAAALIVGGAVLVVSGLLALVGVGQARRELPPVPEQAMAGVRRDVEAVTEGAKR